MSRIQKMLFALTLMIAVTLIVALPAYAATTTEDTGPLQPHVQRTYVFNMKTDELTDKATGAHIQWGFDNGKCPILQKGDAVEVIPAPSVKNEHVCKGFVLVDNEQASGGNYFGPLEITDTAAWGGKTYITGFKNSGDTPLLVWSNSGGDHSSDYVSDEESYYYTRADLDFRYYPNRVNVTYEYFDTHDGHYMDEAELGTLVWYTDEQNPTVFWADDALANRYGANDTVVGVDVHRPYLEGYKLEGYGGDQYRRGSGEGERANLSQIYGYGREEIDSERNAMFYPRWSGSSYDNQTINGSLDDSVYIMFKLARERTITLDANGGTIDGYPSRIYEAGGGDIENKMDEDFAQGAYTPVREGYEFCGWYEDAACTIPVTSFHDLLRRVSWPVAYTYPLEERALHAYAKWKEIISFIDVDESTSHQEDILWLAESGISEGYKLESGDRAFKPYANVARADMAAFLFRMAKNWGVVDDAWQPKGTVKFRDVSAKTPHYREIMWLAESGISKGWDVKGGKKEFRPYTEVARADMAAFLGRLAKLAKRTGKTSVNKKAFVDVTVKVAHCDEIWWMVANGIANGWDVTGGKKEFRPYRTVARCDMAAFLHRMDGVR